MRRVILLIGALLMGYPVTAQQNEECEYPYTQVGDKCLSPRTHVDEAGCCYQDMVVGKAWNIYFDYCLEDDVCGWDTKYNAYNCGTIDNKTFFKEDPSGQHPRECDFTCEPACDGRECGSDMCGGQCGQCKEGEYCEDGKCVPCTCEGKECGDDGCGHPCGECPEGMTCIVDKCAWPNASISKTAGCCYKNHSVRVDDLFGKKMIGARDCDESGGRCGWIPPPPYSIGYYTCFSTVYEDPSGQYPRECDFTCIPDCAGKKCGDNGCGGTCGTCPAGEECIDGRCCHRDCEGKECGPDGCGGFCGNCDIVYEVCKNGKCMNSFGCRVMEDLPGCPGCACEQCVCEKMPSCCWYGWTFECVNLCKEECGGCKACMPDCSDKECGDDGCHGNCGYCKPGYRCEDYHCVKCSTEGKECGYDGCGGYLGDCPKGMYCKDNQCKPCTCDGRECGMNMCGESCGKCKENEYCNAGKCESCTCAGKECGDDGCGHSCGECPYSGQECVDGYCKWCYCDPKYCNYDEEACGKYCDCTGYTKCMEAPPGEPHNICVSCAPYCPKEYECGDNSCRGTCGTCGPREQCISHRCKPIPDNEVPDQGPEIQPEPVPDIAEDVHVEHDIVEVRDQVSDPDKPVDDPGVDTQKDSGHDRTARPETFADYQSGHHDAISTDTAPEAPGGGCSTGPGAVSGMWLILLGIFALSLRRD